MFLGKGKYRPESASGKTSASCAGGMSQRLAIVATLIVWALAQSRGDGHRSLVSRDTRKGTKRV